MCADCCDGSDEYDGQVRCANTCWEAGKASRDKLVKKLNLYKDGIHIRRSEIESAKRLRQQQESKLTTLRKEVKTLSELVQKLRGWSLSQLLCVYLSIYLSVYMCYFCISFALDELTICLQIHHLSLSWRVMLF